MTAPKIRLLPPAEVQMISARFVLSITEKRFTQLGSVGMDVPALEREKGLTRCRAKERVLPLRSGHRQRVPLDSLPWVSQAKIAMYEGPM